MNKKKLSHSSLNSSITSVLAALLCILIGLVVGFLVLLAINPAHAWGDGFVRILKGGFHDAPYGVGKELANAAPLIMTGLSVAFAFKTGLFNIGAAGQYTLGAYGALYCAIMLKLPWFVCLIVATIPPSMGLIIYGTVGEVSIGRLFMAGWVPGILMCVLLMLAVTWSARRFGYKPEHDHPAPLSEILKALLDSIWAILFPVLLIVLIRFGIMSPTESGSFACAYALLVGTVFYHELTWESLLQTLRDSVKDITVITIILAFSGVFGYGIVFDNITVTIANALLGITSNSAILLLLVVVFLLICGMFMETTVIALILTPILLPVMRSIGVNEVVFGMIMMTTVTFGVMTPPVGTALYAVSDIMECPIEETFKKGWPFYLAILGVILFMIFFPQAVLFLPNLVYGA